MNKITTLGVPWHTLTRLLLLVLFCSTSAFSQDDYTTIRKNVNPLAFNLNHDLSENQDSLLLENKFLFKRVRFIGDNAEKVFDFKPAVKAAKIPLNELPLGQYTVMFYQADKIIVFQIDRLRPFGIIDALEADVAALNDYDVAAVELEEVDVAFSEPNISLDEDSIEKKELHIDNEVSFTKAYNLTDLDRTNLQTRENFRRNNLRPNGKPYND